MSRPQPGPGGQRQPPISYKTVPGRNRTQKWNQAKQYNYDGDDWGGFDPYDEYGGEEPSSAGGYDAPPGRVQRQQSFDTGAERQFNAPQPSYRDEGRSSPAMSSASGGHSDQERRRREYSNPGQVPPPLQTRQSPVRPGSRKNSLTAESQANIPSTDSSTSPDKPLPFIRPSDIYKRMAEEKEKERQSLDSNRPSMESLNREHLASSDVSSSQRPLSTVHERGASGEIPADMLPPIGSLSRLGADLVPGQIQASEASHAVPPSSVMSGSAFAGNVPTSGSEIVRDDLHKDETAQPNLRGVVRKAFDRKDTVHSSTTSSAGDVSRSNTDSTSGISPIMSRVPSGANAQQKMSERDTAVPTIAEESIPSHSRSASGQTITPTQAQQTTRDPSQSVYNATTPPQHDSPARLPAVGSIETRRLSGPLSAENVSSPTTTSDSIASEIVGRPRAGTNYSVREADLAQEASLSPTHSQVPEIALAEQSLQSQFLQQHDSSTPAAQSSSSVSQTEQSLPLPPRLGDQSRLNSFQPHLPGEWISPAPTPAIERSEPSNMTPQLQTSQQSTHAAEQEEEAPDFSPNASTSRRSQEHSSPIDTLKNAGSALGAALLSGAGIGHQTHDFAAGAKQEPVDQPEMHPHRRIGELNLTRPTFDREVSDAPTDTNVSMLSEVPPTPPAKDSDIQLAASRSYANPIESRAPPTRTETVATDTSNSDFESDHLRHDIEKTLNRGSADMADQEVKDEMQRDDDALAASVPPTTSTIQHSQTSQPSAAGSVQTQPQISEPEPEPEPSYGTTLTDTVPSSARAALPSQQSRPGLLDQRFSWEMDPGTQSSLAPMAAVGELPGDEDRRSYERPSDGKALHVTNAPQHELVSPISPATKGPTFDTLLGTGNNTASNLAVPAATSTNRNDLTPSPVSFEESTHIPSYYGSMNDAPAQTAANKDLPPRETSFEAETDRKASLPTLPVSDQARKASLPMPSSQEEERTPSVPTSTQSSGRLPPFREILAIKETNTRIETYNTTRQTFAEMNTGLQDWLSKTLAQYPEHRDLTSSDGSLNTQAIQYDSLGKGHRHNPSMLKMRQISNPFDQNAGRTTETPPRPPAKDLAETGRQQMEKMQAKSKDFMKNASVFGGKAQAGAKGLLAKGRSRFGRNEKASPISATPPRIPMIRTVSPLPPLPGSQSNADSNAESSPMPLSTSATPSQDANPSGASNMGNDHHSSMSAIHGANSQNTETKVMSADQRPEASTLAESFREGRPAKRSTLLSTGSTSTATPAAAMIEEPQSRTDSRPQSQPQEGIENLRPTRTNTSSIVRQPSWEYDKTERRPNFFQRLRSRSRSLSRNRPARSNSRPSSMILLDTMTSSAMPRERSRSGSRSRRNSMILLNDYEAPVPAIPKELANKSESSEKDAEILSAPPPIDGNAEKHKEISVPSVPLHVSKQLDDHERERAFRLPDKRRTETWESEEGLAAVAEGKESFEEKRLGVLPSPSTATFTIAPSSPQRTRGDSLPGSPARERRDSAPRSPVSINRNSLPSTPTRRIRRDSIAARLEEADKLERQKQTTVAEPTAEQLPPLPSSHASIPGAQAQSDPPIDVKADESVARSPVENEAEEASTETKQRRRSSAIFTLPSQLKLASPPPPPVPRKIDQTEKADDAPFDETPVEISKRFSIPSPDYTLPDVALTRPRPPHRRTSSLASSWFGDATTRKPVQTIPASLNDDVEDTQAGAEQDEAANHPIPAEHIGSQQAQPAFTPQIQKPDLATPTTIRSAVHDESSKYKRDELLAASLLSSPTHSPTGNDHNNKNIGAAESVVSAPVENTRVDADRASVVSAEAAKDADDSKSDRSRRSSVSSIDRNERQAEEQPRKSSYSAGGDLLQTTTQPNADAVHDQSVTPEDGPIMSSQAVPAGLPAGPLTSRPVQIVRVGSSQAPTRSGSERKLASESENSQEQKFAERLYKSSATSTARPLSFQPLQQDEWGRPAQDQINRATPRQSTIDPVDYNGPPSNPQLYLQHPLLREEGVNAEEPATKQTETLSALPPAGAIRDGHGLEDLQINSIVDDIQLAEEESKRTRRRSGLWTTLTRTSSSGRPLSSNVGDEISPLPSDKRRSMLNFGSASNTRDQIEKPNTLRKPQRASSSAVEPAEDKKKKRLSGLSSWFGRSSTQGHATARPNKLTKRQSMVEHPSQTSSFTQGNRGTKIYNVPAAPAMQYANKGTDSSLQRERSAYDATTASRVTPQPVLHDVQETPEQPYEYYGPSSAEQNLTASSNGYSAPQMPNDGYFNNQYPAPVRPPYQVPQSSYEQSEIPTIPPRNQARGINHVSNPTWPLPMDAVTQQPQGPLRYESSSRVIQTQGPRTRSPPALTTSISAMPTMPDDSYREHVDARSPAREYSDQQTPWAIGLPSHRQQYEQQLNRIQRVDDAPSAYALSSVQARNANSDVGYSDLLEHAYGRRPDAMPRIEQNQNHVNGQSHYGSQHNGAREYTNHSGVENLVRYDRARQYGGYEGMRGASYPGQEWAPTMHDH